jgi:NAD-dependent deacetylase
MNPSNVTSRHSTVIPLHPHDRVFILTGAGISAESGISTFRDPNGVWSKVDVETVATPEAWRRDSKHVWRFYAERRKQAADVRPNPAHYALARLEAELGERLMLCTQNIDPLHERAGSRGVVHMHGELMKSRCDRCERPPFHDERLYLEGPPRCECGGRIRPHVCWFGELPFELDAVLEALEISTVFVSIGTSGTVAPASHFVLWAGRGNPGGTARKYYVGAEEPENAMFFDEVFVGKAGELVPTLFPAVPELPKNELQTL